MRERENAKGHKPTNMSRKEEDGQDNKVRNEQIGHMSDKNTVFSRLVRFWENDTIFTNVLYKERFSKGGGFAMNMKHYQGCWTNLGHGVRDFYLNLGPIMD